MDQRCAWKTRTQADKVTYRIVGADEADIKQKTISINSPIARALIAHKIGDSVEVVVPSGTKEFTILDVIFETRNYERQQDQEIRSNELNCPKRS